MKIVLLSLVALFFLGCSHADKKEKDDAIGKYLYVDKNSTLHIRNNCIRFGSEDKRDFGVKRILSDGFPARYLEKTCSRCVNDEAYEKLEEMAEVDWSQYEVKDDSLMIGW